MKDETDLTPQFLAFLETCSDMELVQMAHEAKATDQKTRNACLTILGRRDSGRAKRLGLWDKGNPVPSARSLHVMTLHERLRDWLTAECGKDAPDVIASALFYEVVSLVAAVTENLVDAEELLRRQMDVGRQQLRAFGVGHMHP